MTNMIQYDKYKHGKGCNTTAVVSMLEVNNMNQFETAATKQIRQSPTHFVIVKHGQLKHVATR